MEQSMLSLHLCQFFEQRTDRDGSLAWIGAGIATKDLLDMMFVCID
jgi:hypothetical protein